MFFQSFFSVFVFFVCGGNGAVLVEEVSIDVANDLMLVGRSNIESDMGTFKKVEISEEKALQTGTDTNYDIMSDGLGKQVSKSNVENVEGSYNKPGISCKDIESKGGISSSQHYYWINTTDGEVLQVLCPQSFYLDKNVFRNETAFKKLDRIVAESDKKSLPEEARLNETKKENVTAAVDIFEDDQPTVVNTLEQYENSKKNVSDVSLVGKSEIGNEQFAFFNKLADKRKIPLYRATAGIIRKNNQKQKPVSEQPSNKPNDETEKTTELPRPPKKQKGPENNSSTSQDKTKNNTDKQDKVERAKHKKLKKRVGAA